MDEPGEVAVGIGWTPLSEPRRPTAAEQAVLDRLVAHAGRPELIAQAASVWVTAVCECGCASVLLHSDGPALSPAAMRELSSTGRDDWFCIDYTRFGEVIDPVTHTLPMLQVIVHVTVGSLHQLEMYAGEGVPVEVPSPDELDQITLM